LTLGFGVSSVYPFISSSFPSIYPLWLPGWAEWLVPAFLMLNSKRLYLPALRKFISYRREQNLKISSPPI
jgi:hypothetical protein